MSLLGSIFGTDDIGEGTADIAEKILNLTRTLDKHVKNGIDAGKEIAKALAKQLENLTDNIGKGAIEELNKHVKINMEKNGSYLKFIENIAVIIENHGETVTKKFVNGIVTEITTSKNANAIQKLTSKIFNDIITHAADSTSIKVQSFFNYAIPVLASNAENLYLRLLIKSEAAFNRVLENAISKGDKALEKFLTQILIGGEKILTKGINQTLEGTEIILKDGINQTLEGTEIIIKDGINQTLEGTEKILTKGIKQTLEGTEIILRDGIYQTLEGAKIIIKDGINQTLRGSEKIVTQGINQTLEGSEILLKRVIEKTVDEGGEKLEKVLLLVMSRNIDLLGITYEKCMHKTVEQVDEKIKDNLSTAQKWFDLLAHRAILEGSNEAKSIIQYGLEDGRKQFNRAIIETLPLFSSHFNTHLDRIEDWLSISGKETIDNIFIQLTKFRNEGINQVEEVGNEWISNISDNFTGSIVSVKNVLEGIIRNVNGGLMGTIFGKSKNENIDDNAKGFISLVTDQVLNLLISKSVQRKDKDIQFLISSNKEKYLPPTIYFHDKEVNFLHRRIEEILNNRISFSNLKNLEITGAPEHIARYIAAKIYDHLMHKDSPLVIEEHVDLKAIKDLIKLNFCTYDREKTLNKDQFFSEKSKKDLHLILFYIQGEEKERFIDLNTKMNNEELLEKYNNIQTGLDKIIVKALQETNDWLNKKVKSPYDLSLLSFSDVNTFVENSIPKVEIQFNHYLNVLKKIDEFLKREDIVKICSDNKNENGILVINKLLDACPAETRIKFKKSLYLDSKFNVDVEIIEERFGNFLELLTVNQFLQSELKCKYINIIILSKGSGNIEGTDQRICQLSQKNGLGLFKLNYYASDQKHSIEIRIEEIPGLKKLLGIREIEEIINDSDNVKKIKNVIMSYINDLYYYDEFFELSEKYYKNNAILYFFNLGYHLEKITQKENPEHLYCTGKTFLRMKYFEKAKYYYDLALEKYQILLTQYQNNPYYSYQVTLLEYLIEKIISRKSGDLLIEEILLSEETFPRTLNFSPDYSEIDFDNLIKLKDTVKSVNLEGCSWLTDDVLEKIIDKLPLLEILNLEGCFNLTDKCIKSIAKQINLRSLSLAYCRGIEFSEEIFNTLSGLKKLHFLYLNGSALKDDDLKNITYLSELKMLSLENCDQLVSLENLKEMISLTHVCLLGCCSLTKDFLVNIGELKNLEYLELGPSVKLDDENIEHLKKLLQLKDLRLHHCKNISENGMNSLLESLLYITNLHLNCSGSEIQSFIKVDHLKLISLQLFGASKMTSLEGLEYQTNLNFLDLTQCSKLVDRDLKNFITLINLETLKLNGCSGLSADGICRLLSYNLQKLHQLEIIGSHSLRSDHIQFLEELLNSRIKVEKIVDPLPVSWPEDPQHSLSNLNVQVVGSKLIKVYKKNVLFSMAQLGGNKDLSLFSVLNNWLYHQKQSILAVALKVNNKQWAYVLCVRPKKSSNKIKPVTSFLLETDRNSKYADSVSSTISNTFNLLKNQLQYKIKLYTKTLEMNNFFDSGVAVLNSLENTLESFTGEIENEDVWIENLIEAVNSNSIEERVTVLEKRRLFKNVFDSEMNQF